MASRSNSSSSSSTPLVKQKSLPQLAKLIAKIETKDVSNIKKTPKGRKRSLQPEGTKRIDDPVKYALNLKTKSPQALKMAKNIKEAGTSSCKDASDIIAKLEASEYILDTEEDRRRVAEEIKTLRLDYIRLKSLLELLVTDTEALAEEVKKHATAAKLYKNSYYTYCLQSSRDPELKEKTRPKGAALLPAELRP